MARLARWPRQCCISVLPISAVATTINVITGNSEDLTSPDSNADTSVLSRKQEICPVFDNDYSTAMSAFLDSGSAAQPAAPACWSMASRPTAPPFPPAPCRGGPHQSGPLFGTVLLAGPRTDGDYYALGRRIHYHGQFNFLFHDSALKRSERPRRPASPSSSAAVYEGHVTGPIPHFNKSGFLISFNRAEEDLDAMVIATEARTAKPIRWGSFRPMSLPQRSPSSAPGFASIRRKALRLRAILLPGLQHAQNQGVGSQGLASGGYNDHYSR